MASLPSRHLVPISVHSKASLIHWPRASSSGFSSHHLHCFGSRTLVPRGLLGLLSVAGIIRRRSTVRMTSSLAGSSGVRKTGEQLLGSSAAVSSTARSSSSQAREWQSLAHIYCINLDHRPERWSFMQKQFQRMQMPVERFSAINGRKLNVPELAELGLVAMEALPRYYLPDEQKLFGTDLTDGGIGCALSHMFIWRDIISRCSRGEADERDPFLVIEDDCLFADGFTERAMLDRMAHVPNDWEMVYLGGQDLLRKQQEYQVASGVRRLYKGFRETTAYIINAAGAKTCLDVCVPMYWQVDTHLNDESLREGFKRLTGNEKDYTMRPRGYCLWPPMVVQHREGFPTDVQTVEHN